MEMGREGGKRDKEEKSEENENLYCSLGDIHFLTHSLVHNTCLYCKNIKLFLRLIQPHDLKTWEGGLKYNSKPHRVVSTSQPL